MSDRPIIYKVDFLRFMSDLITDLKTNPDSWENSSLPNFLEALARWTEDMEGYYLNTHQEIPQNISWDAFADMLKAASMYE